MGRLTGLDGLRGVAALCVVGYHASFKSGDFAFFFSRSYLAVDFFFMLSGYVMARTYEQRFAEGLTPARFAWKRYKRLWPPMIFGAGLGLAALLVRGNPLGTSLAVFLTTFFMMPNPVFRPLFANSPAWSIFFELFANWFHAVSLWRVRTQFLLVPIVASLAMMCVWAIDNISFGHDAQKFVGGFGRVLLPYCIGIALWRHRVQSMLPAWAAYPILAAALMFMPVGLFADLAFVCVVCPLVIWLGTGSGGGSWASALGKLSFPLYAVHFPILRLTEGMGPWFGVIAAITFAAALTVALERRIFSTMWVDLRQLLGQAAVGRVKPLSDA